jgi:hypothetical protein
VTRVPKWGRVADPEPRIVSLLRTLKTRGRVRGSTKAYKGALRELDEILAVWIASESIDKLRAALGVARVADRRGGRRSQQAVEKENRIVLDLVAHALRGTDVSTFRAAADALGCDEKQIERAWKQWGELQSHWLRMSDVLTALLTAEQAAAAAAAIRRLPKVVDTE